MRGTSLFAVIFAVPLALCQPADPVAQGIALFHQGHYAAARAILEKAPASEHSRVFLALSRAALGDCAAVSADLARQFDQAADPDLRRLAGLAAVQCYVAQNHYADAFPVATRLAALYPKDADVLYQSARLYMKAWNDTLYQMFRNTPASFRVNQISAEIFEVQNHYAEAIAEYRKAIEKNPSALDLHFRLGRALMMQSHSPEALDAAQKNSRLSWPSTPPTLSPSSRLGSSCWPGKSPSRLWRVSSVRLP